MSDDEMDNWQPPNEAQLKVMEARRERNNQISRIMGNYMLKGYRMLDRLCPVCNTILLQDKNNEDYCVACRELESETSKDDPAISETAAAASFLEQNQRQSNLEIAQHSKENQQVQLVSDLRLPPGQPSGDSATASDTQKPQTLTKEGISLESTELFSSYLRIKAKINDLTKRLTENNSLDETQNICQTIKCCAESAMAIKQLL